jgi:hypothetical protein
MCKLVPTGTSVSFLVALDKLVDSELFKGDKENSFGIWSKVLNG